MFAYSIKWKFTRMGEDFCLWVAKHMPKKLRYWVVIYSASAMTCSPEHKMDLVPDQKVMDLLKFMEK